MKSQHYSRESGGVFTIIWGGPHKFSISVRTGTSRTQNYRSSQSPPTSTPNITPQMSVIFKNGNIIKVSYLGKLKFLDNQASFAEVFGNKPTILAPNIITLQYSTSKSRSLNSLGEKFKLDVFL